MRDLDLAALPVAGALGREATADGVILRRLPDWTRPQLVDPGLQLVVAMPAGVRLELATDTRSLELDLMSTEVQVATQDVFPAVVDLVVDGRLQESRLVEGGARLRIALDRSVDVSPGSPVTVRFDDLPGRPGTAVEVWLPHAAVVELRGVRVDDGAAVAPLERRRRRWVHVGSSISHCLEAPTPTQTWPALVARRADVDLVGLGLAGQCMLDGFTARTVRDLDADLISLKAGINVVNADSLRERTYVPALHAFLDTVREGHPDTPLVLATPIVCPVVEDHPGPTVLREDGRVHVVPRVAELSTGALTLRRIRELMTEVVEVRRAAGDAHLHLLDGLALLGPDEADALPDGLHPDGAGYRLMAERFHALAFGAGGPFATPG